MNRREIDRLYELFGRQVQECRKKHKGMTQEELGDRIGLSRTSVTNIEKGRHHCSLHQILSIADVLEVSLTSLLPSIEDIISEEKVSDRLREDVGAEIAKWAENIVAESELKKKTSND